MNDERLFELVEQVYAAPGTSAGWFTFLDNLRATLRGSTANLVRHDLRGRRGNLLVTVGDELIAHPDLQRTAFDSDSARRYDLVRMIGGVVEAGPAASSLLSISRTERLDPFGGTDAAFLEALLPHVRRALLLYERLMSAETTESQLAQVVNRSPVATLFVTARAEVTFLNEAASRLVMSRDGLVVERRELRTTHASDTARLRQLIADAAALSRSVRNGGLMAIGRPSGRRPLAALVSPLVPKASWQVPNATVAAVFVSDPEETAEIEEAALGTLFSLTRAESRLAVLLAKGASLKEASAALGVRRETVRSRLKTIFDKTGTNRQSDLVRLLLMSSGGGRGESLS